VLAWRGATDASHPSLDGAAQEVAFLQRRIEGTVVRDGDHVKELPLEADLARWGVLHFAAHARAVEQSPWESGLLCADSVAGGSPWLTARQIAPMRLNARLAFLSGCETAGGRVRGGEGVTGLASAFQSAGVASVVASLWKVDDVATARLVEVFYERLLAGDSVAAALEAGRAILRRDRATAHPHYWAGFVVTGDGAARISLRGRGFGTFPH
jgi:CHAT domain-containing protein